MKSDREIILGDSDVTIRYIPAVDKDNSVVRMYMTGSEPSTHPAAGGEHSCDLIVYFNSTGGVIAVWADYDQVVFAAHISNSQRKLIEKGLPNTIRKVSFSPEEFNKRVSRAALRIQFEMLRALIGA